MPIRLIVSMNARSGKGDELLEEMEKRCIKAREEPGCEQFEVFRSGKNADSLVLLELWTDREALDVHAKRISEQPPNPRIGELREAGPSGLEDYEYNKTR